jgi:hypothetical protein
MMIIFIFIYIYIYIYICMLENGRLDPKDVGCFGNFEHDDVRTHRVDWRSLSVDYFDSGLDYLGKCICIYKYIRIYRHIYI